MRLGEGCGLVAELARSQESPGRDARSVGWKGGRRGWGYGRPVAAGVPVACMGRVNERPTGCRGAGVGAWA